MIYKSILASAVVVLTASAAMAATSTVDPGEAKVFAQAKITAGDAVAAVESNSGGKVVELTLLDQAGKTAYQVSVVQKDGTEMTFLVDGVSGAVSSANDVQSTAQVGGDATEAGEGRNDADSANEDAD